MKKILRSFSLIINYKTFIITALSVLSSYICFRFGLTAKFPDMLVGVAIVFPVVFSIGSAYTRRETALQRYADFKGHAIAVYFATRDWTTSKESDLPKQVSQLVQDMIHKVKVMVKLTPVEWQAREKEMYSLFSIPAFFIVDKNGQFYNLSNQPGRDILGEFRQLINQQ